MALCDHHNLLKAASVVWIKSLAAECRLLKRIKECLMWVKR